MVITIAAISGCGNGDKAFDDAGFDAGLFDAPSVDASFVLPDAGEAGPCPIGCSSDLHDVVDCHGNVITACTGTQGCDVATNTCINACTAAVDNKNSVGCEYYATFMEADPTACFAAYVANTWDTPATIMIDYAGTTFTNIASFTALPVGSGTSLTYNPYPGTLAPGEVAVLFLGGEEGGNPKCVVQPAVPTTGSISAMVSGTGIGSSFHITTDVPVVAFEMNPFGGGNTAITGGSLLLPVSVWDTNYIAATAEAYSTGTPSINIIAQADNTTVTILPKVALAGGNGIPSGPANVPASFTLNAGQEAQIEQEADLAGSVIQSTGPVGVMAGNPCGQAPIGTSFCDHGEQMLPPVHALGSEYVGVMYRSRTGEPAIWRLVGAVKGTNLTFSTPIGASSGYPAAPATLNQGDVAEFSTATPFIVTSQDSAHPFMLFEIMSSSQWAYMPNKGPNKFGYGDPDLNVQVPPQQYLSNYVIMADPTYPETSLTLIRELNKSQSFDDVMIDCLTGPITGWQPVGANYEYARLDLQTGDFLPVGTCSNGVHQLMSATPFALSVWGWGTPLTGTTQSTFTANVSYSYPGGMNLQPINNVVVNPTPN